MNRQPPIRLTLARYAAMFDPARPRPDLGPWETACAAQGVIGRAQVVAVTREPASDDLAARLGVAAGAELVRRGRRMWAGDDLAQLQDAWMPAELVDGTPLAAAASIAGGVLAAMAAAGLAPASVDEDVIARPATDDERAALRLDDAPADPVLEVWRTTYDQADRVLEVARVVADPRLCVFGSGPPTAPEQHRPVRRNSRGDRRAAVRRRRRPRRPTPSGSASRVDN